MSSLSWSFVFPINGMKSVAKQKVYNPLTSHFQVLLSYQAENFPAVSLDKHTRKWLPVAKISRNKYKVEVVSSTTEIKSFFETKIDSVTELSLSDHSMPLVQSICRYLRQRTLCTCVVHSVLLRTLWLPNKLVDYGTVGSRSMIV